MIRLLLARLGCCLVLLVLAACGGGGGGGDGGATQAAALAISAVSPQSAAPGATLTVSGSGFSRVTSVRLGSDAAAFQRQSDSSLTVQVPAQAISGALELSGGGSAVVSAFSVTVTAATVSAIEPAQVPAGGRVILRGSFLDGVSGVRLGTVTLPIVARAADQLTVDVPAEALSGTPVLTGAGGQERVARVALTVLQPVRVDAASPAAGIVGSNLTLTGNGLDRVQQVLFGSVGAAPGRAQNGSLSVAVPAGLAPGSYNLSLRTLQGDSVALTSTFRVAAAITVGAMSPAYGLAGTVVTITGSGLDEVSGITLNGGTVAIAAGRSAGQLRFTVPAGASSGAVLLLSASQPAVTAGGYAVSAAPPPTVARIDFAQSYSQQAGDAYQRLVPNKPVLVRAYVLGSVSGTPNPGVTLLVRNGSGATVASLPMNGPATLPTAAQPYSLAQTFNVTLTAAQVPSGFNVTVAPLVGNPLSATPAMGLPTNLKLTLVRLQAGGSTAAAFDTATVRGHLVRALPFADGTVDVAARSGSYHLTRLNAPPTDFSDWQTILDEVDELRRNEAPARHYFGIVPRPNLSGAQTVGLGYVNQLGQPRFATAVGIEAGGPGDHYSTMLHELGHNFGRGHSSCSNVIDPDPSYPYAGGLLGNAPLFDSTQGTLSDPSGEADLMGYCNASWFADYNYRGAQTYLESNAYAQVLGAPAETDLLVIRGRIGPDGVRFAPVAAMRGQPDFSAGGSHLLRIALADGSVREQPVRTVEVADGAPGTRAFRVALPYPGALAGLALLEDGQPLPDADRVGASRAGAGPVSPPQVDWREAGGTLRLGWNAAAYPRLTVVHVGAERRVLAVGLTGGSADVALDGVPAGGRFEFALARELDARVVVGMR